MYAAVRSGASRRESGAGGVDLLERIETYIARFLAVGNHTPADATAAYERFLRRYMEGVARFIATEAYPEPPAPGCEPISRWEYDAALLLSVLVTEHRFRIMDLTAAQAGASGRVAVAGAGAGLEVELIKPSGCELHGWDLSLSETVARLHGDIALHECAFPDGGPGSFDRIFLIEVLEHVREPYELLAQCVRSLHPGGRVVLTTASNIPQFDHVFNFPVDHGEFRERTRELGLRIVQEVDIPHRWIASDIDSRNRFFVLERG